MERMKLGLLKNARLLRCAANRTAQRISIYASRFVSCTPCIQTFLNSPRKGVHIGKQLAYLCFVLLISVLFSSCSSPSSYVQKEPAKGIYHRVKKGETFRNIARAYHVKLQDLAEANNISNPGLIQEGSILFIPDANQIIDDVIASAKTMDAEAKVPPMADNAANVKPPSENSKAKNGKAAAESAKISDKKTVPQELAPAAESTPTQKPAGEKSEHKPKSKSTGEEKEEIQFEKKLFAWPVRGSVKTRFGIQPNKTYHNWIKIVSAAGTQVKAAASGIVIFSAQLKDYGDTIIIRHEDSFATVYTHLKKRYVKTDQKVKKGEVIALIGETDEAGDAFMNFEVRLRGKARNPLFFLP
jgi:lipoprotein NlpD